MAFKISQRRPEPKQAAGSAKFNSQLLCLVLEISILFSFLQSKLSNKVIFLHEPGLLYNLVICFENNMLFRKTDLVFAILNLRLVILLKNERSAYIIIWLQSSVVLQGLS